MLSHLIPVVIRTGRLSLKPAGILTRRVRWQGIYYAPHCGRTRSVVGQAHGEIHVTAADVPQCGRHPVLRVGLCNQPPNLGLAGEMRVDASPTGGLQAVGTVRIRHRTKTNHATHIIFLYDTGSRRYQ